MIRSLLVLLLIAQTYPVLGDEISSASDRPDISAPQPIRQQLEHRASSLRRAITEAAVGFERYLKTVDLSDEEASDFVARLDWPDIRSELGKASPDLLLLRSSTSFLNSLRSSTIVLIMIPLREALDQYTDVQRVLQLPDIEREAQRRQTAVRRLLASERRLDTVRLGEHLDWLALVGRPMSLPAVRQQHDQPNIALDIPKSVVTERIKQFNQEVTQSQYISNVVAGTPISGVTYTSGTATAQLLPDENAAGFRIDLQGTINAPSNVAVQSPVLVYTSGQTSFSANKEVTWDGKKLVWGPTFVSCQTQAAITGIAVTREPILSVGRRPGPLNRVIERAAWRRAEQQRPQGEAAASRLAETTVAESFNEQVSELVGNLNSQIDQYVIRPLLQSGMMPAIDARIQPQALTVSLLRNGSGGLAGTQRLDWKTGKDEFALHFHESALTSFLRASAGGAVWTDRKFSELQRVLIGTNSYEMRIGLHQPWQVILDWHRPLVTRFDTDQVVIQLNMESLRIGQNDYRFPFSVEATYQYDARPPSLGFIRVGDLRFQWTGEFPSDPEQKKLLSSFVRQKFSGLLLDELYLDGLKVPSGGGFWGSLGKYRPSRVDSEQGWMLITFHDETGE